MIILSINTFALDADLFFILSEIYEKGKQAFVSYIKAYSKNECSHIFQIKELDFVKLGYGFGLIHLPRMPEIKKELKYESFVKVETSQIPYK